MRVIYVRERFRYVVSKDFCSAAGGERVLIISNKAGKGGSLNMRSVCPEYQRFSRAYQRAFIAWGEPKNVNGHEAIGDDLDALEKKYRLLADHQQSCPACLAELGIVVLAQDRAYAVAERSTT